MKIHRDYRMAVTESDLSGSVFDAAKLAGSSL